MDKQIIKSDENMLRLNDICITCVSEIEECDCRKVAEDLCLKLSRKEQECEYLKKKLLRKEAVIEFASCPSYGYSDNTIEATCTKTFCYDIESCEHKTMVKYEQALTEIKEIAEFSYRPYRVCGEYNDCCEIVAKILSKISEVMDD